MSLIRWYILFALISCTSSPSAQQDGAVLGFDFDESVGGWKEQPLEWQTAQEDYALLRQALILQNPNIELLDLLKVETQVVAGFNLRLTAKYRKGEETGLVQGVFYHNINQEVSLNEINFIKN